MNRILIALSLSTMLFGIGLRLQRQAFAAGQTYYVCDCDIGADLDCIAGDDSAAGTGSSVPWQTFEKARAEFNSTLTGGDAIRFCQGGALDIGSAGTQWFNQNCAAAQPCLVSDYSAPWASGDESRPILIQTADKHAFELSNGGSAVADGGYTFENLDLRCPGCSANGGWGFFLFNDVNDVLIDNIAIDSFAIGIHLAGSNSCQGGDVNCNGQNDRITISNSTLTNNHGQGILGAANDLLIENNLLDQNGSGTVFEHNLYVSGGQNITIRGNELYRASIDGSGACGGTSLVGHGTLTHLLIEGNFIHEDIGKANQSCWGISISTGYVEAESFSNVVIRGNRIENVGNVAIGTGSCISCTLENNAIVHEQGFGTSGIVIPDKSPGAGDATSSQVVIRNNSLSLSGGSGISLNEGSGHTIVSNAIRHFGTDTGWQCFNATQSAGNYTLIDHNLCETAVGSWANGSDLAAWQQQGFGAHSAATPTGFISNTNLRPAAESAAIVNAGHLTRSSSIEIGGNTRFGQPDIGAYEWLQFQPLWLPLLPR